MGPCDRLEQRSIRLARRCVLGNRRIRPPVKEARRNAAI
jgi:hypothetical protein